MLDEQTKKQFEDALASGRLKELCDQMRAEGRSQVAIYERFSEFFEFLGNSDRKTDYDALASSLECIVGWCAPGARWFDHYLTNEEIYAHQCGLTEKEIREIAALVNGPEEFFCTIRKEQSGELEVTTFTVEAGTYRKGRKLIVRKGTSGWLIAGEGQ